MTEFAKPFVIGLKPLELSQWIELPSDLEIYLEEKERLLRQFPQEVFFAEDGTADAQAEVKSTLVDHLLEQHPQRYALEQDAVIIDGFRQVPLDAAEPPLLTAARLVSDDLVLMRRGESGWRLAAASLSFPSSWSLRMKAGKPLTRIHQPVPGFGKGSRNAQVIERLFDNLQPDQAVTRQNWSLYPEDDLYHPTHNTMSLKKAEEFLRDPFIRTERQTLRKLARSGDIVFTIDIRVLPMSHHKQTAEGQQALSGLAGHLAGMSEAQTDYKGITAYRQALIARLRGETEKT